ncbi:uncharacterized protein LOC133723970 [Rosa rugosa]|uniref:uncharacterized protein LOC133723970 n=1 Tax=Rosa rugosa TaxID=74645 RepID=UPI002B40D25B|nr:uncharacterized protein LOC133723970 [Rosa rugosa]
MFVVSFSLILSPQFGACLPKFTFNVPTEEKKLVLVSDALVSYSSQYPLLILEFSTCCCSGFLIGFGSKQKSLSGGHEFKNEGFGPGTVILCDQVLTEGKQKDVLKAAGALFSHICEV